MGCLQYPGWGLRVGPHPHGLSGPPPPGAQSGPPPSCAQSGPPGCVWAPGGGQRPMGSVVRRPPAPCQLVPSRVAVLVLTRGLFCVCTCVLAASAFSISFGSDTRYSSLFSSAPAGPPSPVSSLLSPLMPAPLSPPALRSPAVLPSSPWVCLRDVPSAGPALSRCFSHGRDSAETGRRLRRPALHSPGRGRPCGHLCGAPLALTCSLPRLRGDAGWKLEKLGLPGLAERPL